MEAKTVNEWVVLAGTTGGIVTAVWLYGRRICRRIGAMRWIAKQPWRDGFGENPASAIRDILNDLSNAQDLTESIIEVVCRKLHIGIYICNATDGACIYSSDSLAEIFGITPNAMLGFGWSAQIVGGEEIVQHWESCVRRKITYRSNYAVRNALTEKMVQCRTEAHYLASGGGRYVGWLEVVIK